MSKINEVLTKLYYDPLEGLMGINTLYTKAKKIIKNIKLKDVQSWYKKQATTQIHYRKNKKISYLPIFSYKPGAFQMDLTEMKRLSSKNKGYKHILTAINVNTRKLYAYKSKTKSATAIKTLLKQFKKDVETHNANFSEKKRPPSPYISSSPDDMVERLSLLLSSQSAGNISDKLFNEASQIIDKLKSMGILSATEVKKLYKK